jgi:zinc protease
MKDIQEYTPAKLRKFYDTYYVPNNAVLVLAGDFDSAKTKALIEKYYSKLETKPLPERTYPQEPDITAPIEKVLAWDVQTKSFVTAFKGVQAGHPDSYALDLASAILGGGSSSRLFKKLVYQQQIATSTSAYNMTTADPGVFMVSATMKPGQDTVQAQKTVLEQIEVLKKNLVKDSELQKVKNQTMMEFMDGLTIIDGKAQSLAVNEIIFGDYNRLFEDLDKYNKVTPADVQRVMKKYIVPEKRVVAILEPKTKLQ